MDSKNWVHVTIRCPDFYFNIDNQVQPDEQHFVDDFGSEDDDGYITLFFKKVPKECWINTDEQYGTKSLQYVCYQLLGAFMNQNFDKFIKTNFGIEVYADEEDERRYRSVFKKQIKENAYAELRAYEGGDLLGYFNFKNMEFIDVR